MVKVKCGRIVCKHNEGYECTLDEILLHPVSMRISPDPVPKWLMMGVYCIYNTLSQTIIEEEK